MLTKKIFFERSLLVLFVVIVLSVFIYFWGYFSIYPYCLIRVKGHVLGDTHSIRDALTMFREKNPESFSNFCSKIDKIIEANCFEGDGYHTGDWISTQPGCYIKSTKIIYLKPSKEYKGLAEERYNALEHLNEVIR